MENRVVCTHNRHFAFIIKQDTKVTKFLAVTAQGVIVEQLSTSAFTKEYSVATQYMPEKAALMFLKALQRGYLYNHQAYQFLKEIIMENNNVVDTPLRQALEAASSPTEAQENAEAKKAEKAAKVKAAKPPKEPKPRGQGIGAFCIEQIKTGADNTAILAEVKAKWPDAKTTPASLAWYRNSLKKAA